MSTLKQYDSATGKFVPVAYSGRDAESILNSVGDVTQLQTTNKTSTVAAINELVAHKAEIVSQVFRFIRSTSLPGLLTITTSGKPKAITIIATLKDGTTDQHQCIGFYSHNGLQSSRTLHFAGTTVNFIAENYGIYFFRSGALQILGTIKNITPTSFDIDWAFSGAALPAVDVQVTAKVDYHGE